jgi:xanthine dehydrogenase FAD-binding subunit
MLDCDDYLVPETLDGAFDSIDAHRGRHRIVAGATDLLPWAREGRAGDVHYPVLIDITRVPELRGVTVEAGRLRIGAATPIQQFLTDPVLRRHAPVMPHVAVWFADDQLRRSATIGGNLVNASPAADGMPGMMVMNGAAVLTSRARGERRVPLADFATGPGATVLEDDEILCAIECDSTEGYGAAFEKVGHRRSLVIATVGLAALVRLDDAGSVFNDVRLALAGVGPVPARLDECERALIGKPVSAALIDHAAGLSAGRVQSRTRQDYRREVVAGFIRRGLADALAAAGCRLDDTKIMSREAAHG